MPIDQKHCPHDEALEKLLLQYKSKTDEKYSRVVTRFNKKLTHPERTRETELGDLFADILKKSLNIDIMLLGSGSIRCEELGPIVLYSDLVTAFPYDDEVYMLTVTGAQLKSMIKYMLRDEVWEGAHCEFYQFSVGMQVIYSRETHDFITFSLNGIPVEDNRTYSIALQRFHYLNTQIGFGIPLEEITQLHKPRIVATSCREILDEYLSSHQRIEQSTENRLVVI